MSRIVYALIIVLALQPSAGAAPPQLAQGERSLYQRLGGYDAIAAVTDDFLGRLAADASLGRFFVGHGTDSVQRIRQDIVDFLCKATAGPCVYGGRDMKTAHAGLGISGSDWDKMLVHLNATFNKFQVPQGERNELLAAVAGLRKDIVE